MALLQNQALSQPSDTHYFETIQQEGPPQMQPLDLGLPSLQKHELDTFLLSIIYPVCGFLL